jgi:type IV secretory pathway VirD2 relaxase
MARPDDDLMHPPAQTIGPGNDERDRLRPKMGRRARLAKASPGIARLVLRGHGRRAGAGGKVGPLPAGVGPGRHARRVLIHAHVQRMTAYGAKAAAEHLAYIERDGAEKDGAPAVLYGPDGPVPRERFEEPRLNEQHQFRFVVSPEDGHDLDLHDYVRGLMARVERELGRSLEWAACNHHDTDHPHTHVIVRGVDRHGGRVLLSRQYISHGMRWTAQELATEHLGPRLESEIRRAREREVTQERWTSLDRELQHVATDRQVDLTSVRRRSRNEKEAQHLVDRLEHIEGLGVAERISPTTWQLAEGWEKHLRQLGERGDIVKQMHRAMRGGDPARFHSVRPGQALPDGKGGVEERELVGRVAGKGLEDEAKGIWYAVLETPTGAAYHVRLSARQAEATRTGDLVTFRTRPDAAMDPAAGYIAEIAGQRGGVYSLEGNVRRDAAPRGVPARLRDLERRGLVTAQGPGQWAVPPDLIEQLERRRREAPRYRLFIGPVSLSLDAQVARHGPVWLDTVEPRTLAAEGFGAEVRGALERRREVLGKLGIDPSDAKRHAKLRELERLAFGKDIARKTAETFLESVPTGFRGRLQCGPEGSPYMAVTDGRRFVLLPASPEARSRAGQTVEVSRDATGRAVLAEDGARVAERQELARRAVGEVLARETRRTFLPTVPLGFRGRVEPGSERSPYVAVSDGLRFILIPASPDSRALAGRTVDVARDAQGRFLGVQPRDRGHDRGR